MFIRCIKSNGHSVSKDVPTWAGIHSLLPDSNWPMMHVGFLPFIPRPVTESATFYTALLNFVKVASQKGLQDEDFFHTVAEIIIQHPDNFACWSLYFVVSIWYNIRCIA